MTTRTRLRPEARREQLLDLGTRLLATHGLESLSLELLAEEAGISRSLLYHYFDGLPGFRRAVVERAVADLVEATAPQDVDDPVERLTASMAAYVDYVRAHRTGYTSLVRAANGGDPVIKALYDDGRRTLLNRMFDATDAHALEELGFRDTPGVRLVLLGWSAMAETMVLTWVQDPAGVSQDEMVAMLVGALPGALTAAPPG